MVLLDSDEFLKQLAAMVVADAENAAKSLRITYKRHIPNTRSWRHRKTAEEDLGADGPDPVCLVRARLGDCKISTHVTSEQLDEFASSMNAISELMNVQSEEEET